MCYGTELTSNAILSWADETGVGWYYIASGKPQHGRPGREGRRAPCLTEIEEAIIVAFRRRPVAARAMTTPPCVTRAEGREMSPLKRSL